MNLLATLENGFVMGLGIGVGLALIRGLLSLLKR